MALVKISTEKNTLVTARAKAMGVAKINYDQWNDTMFEVGCRFLEAYTTLFLDSKKMYANLAYHPQLGFWNWWKLKYMQDDVEFADSAAVYPEDYLKHKAYMIGGGLLERQLEDFLNAQNF